MGPFGSRLAPLSLELSDANGRSIAETGPLVVNLDQQQHPEVALELHPRSQRYHDAQNFRIMIHDQKGVPPEHRLQVFHNHQDVSREFLALAEYEWSADKTTLSVNFPHLRLPTHQNHVIQVSYRRGDHAGAGPLFTVHFDPPRCPLKTHLPISDAGNFQRHWGVLRKIESLAQRRGINPTLLAGLVAQESSFNPRAVSSAKALGLTQITSLAEPHILEEEDKRSWPSFESIQSMSYPLLKLSVMSGKINAQNEWRLHTEKSLEGGLAYLNFLEDYWSIPAHWAQLESSFGGVNLESETMAEVILASYNSGPFRVRQALAQHGPHWLEAPNLQEARNYVRQVQSYCDLFANAEGR